MKEMCGARAIILEWIIMVCRDARKSKESAEVQNNWLRSSEETIGYEATRGHIGCGSSQTVQDKN